MDLTELKTKMNEACQIYYDAKPFRNKSFHRVLSIIAEGGADLATLKSDITRANTDRVALKSKIDALADTSLLDNFKTKDDADMRTYVNGRMPGLAGDSQKLDVAVIIQQAKR